VDTVDEEIYVSVMPGDDPSRRKTSLQKASRCRVPFGRWRRRPNGKTEVKSPRGMMSSN
jgi:hypothetical protein